jgi:translocation-and-assembly-module (TAM) inner membrane subunit TamB-like protein
MPGKRAKRVLRFFIWLLLVIVVLAVSLPLWFPWVLRPAAKRFGATFQTYERLGYAAFAVDNASYSNRNVRVTARRLEFAPMRGRAAAEDWSVVVKPTGQGRTNALPSSVHRVYQQVSKIISEVQHYVPRAALTNGYIETPKVAIRIPGVRWSEINLSGQAQISNALPLTTVTARIPSAAPVHVEFSSPSLELQSHVVVSNTPQAISIRAENRWRTNDFSIVASFGTEGALPTGASLTANGVVFGSAKGDLSFVWEENRYVVNAEGAVLSEKEPVEFKARLTGDTNSARLGAAEVTAPWARAELQASVPLRYKRPFVGTDAVVSVTADLTKQSRIAAEGQLDGQVWLRPDLTHSGSILVRGFSISRVHPSDVAVDWSGAKSDLDHIHAKMVGGGSAISVSGAAELSEKRFRVTELVLGTNEVDFRADVRWPDIAKICARATNIAGEGIGGFIDLPYEQVALDHLRLAVGWTNGPLAGDLDFAGRTILADGTHLGAEAALAAHASGLTITNFTFTRNGEPVSGAYGTIPISITVSNKPFVVPLTNEALQVQVTADPRAFFWKLLEGRLGIGTREPELQAELSGTWSKPRGRLSLRASSVKFRGTAPEVPALDSLALLAHIHENAGEIEFLNFFVTNQPVTFSGHMPLPEHFWKAPQTNVTKLDWRDLTCRLGIHSAQIAAFVPLLPGVVAPQGIIDADLGLVPGGKLDGELRIDGAATRPIAALGALQDIEILCRFAGDKANINSYVALGGYTALGAGRVKIDPNELLRRELPTFEFHLTGENVPLTRQPDAVVRADLDVTITHGSWEAERLREPQPVIISGNLNLRDSLYLRELRDLVPGRLASADRRPPYFSVEAKPFADWQLYLNAGGHRFLKVRTPIFNGEVSADLKLSGTLRDPVAIGDVTIDAGLVRFPFGTIPISQGIVSLTSDNPYRPRLLITGNDRVLGYDLNMELAGFADAPVLQFSSTPPLSSEQILLMLTAGEIPRQSQFAFTTEQRAQRLAFFLGRGVLSDLGFGGDSNRLTVRSGEHITETGRPTYSVEYELTDDWSVIGQYDRFNDFNLMLKWQVYSK